MLTTGVGLRVVFLVFVWVYFVGTRRAFVIYTFFFLFLDWDLMICINNLFVLVFYLFIFGIIGSG